jgi:hypothetical protein
MAHKPTNAHERQAPRADVAEQSTLDHNLAPAPPPQAQLALAHLAHGSRY